MSSSRSPDDAIYAAMVAAALRRHLGNTRGATKIVMRWTGASERAVKNWFAGTRGPNGMHLVSLVQNSDAVLEGLLKLAERDPAVAVLHLSETRKRLVEMLRLLPQTTSLGPEEPV